VKVEEAKDVCEDRSKWKELIGRDVMYVCLIIFLGHLLTSKKERERLNRCLTTTPVS
jgi:hypothetical protein